MKMWFIYEFTVKKGVYMSFLNRNVYKSDESLADHFSGTPESKWGGGIIIPSCIAIYALHCCITQHAEFSDEMGCKIELLGKQAVVFGLAWLSGAFFLHFHYFWPTLKRLWIFTNIGKLISMLCLIGAFGYVLISIIMG